MGVKISTHITRENTFSQDEQGVNMGVPLFVRVCVCVCVRMCMCVFECETFAYMQIQIYMHVQPTALGVSFLQSRITIIDLVQQDRGPILGT